MKKEVPLTSAFTILARSPSWFMQQCMDLWSGGTCAAPILPGNWRMTSSMVRTLINKKMRLLHFSFLFRSYNVLLHWLEEQLADSGHKQWLSHLLGSAFSAAFGVGSTPQRSVTPLVTYSKRYLRAHSQSAGVWSLHYELSFWCFFWAGARVRRLAKHPTEPSWVLSAVQGNNEISMWNMETGFRQVVLWASNTPPLSQTQVNYSW